MEFLKQPLKQFFFFYTQLSIIRANSFKPRWLYINHIRLTCHFLSLLALIFNFNYLFLSFLTCPPCRNLVVLSGKIKFVNTVRNTRTRVIVATQPRGANCARARACVFVVFCSACLTLKGYIAHLFQGHHVCEVRDFFFSFFYILEE